MRGLTREQLEILQEAAAICGLQEAYEEGWMSSYLAQGPFILEYDDTSSQVQELIERRLLIERDCQACSLVGGPTTHHFLTSKGREALQFYAQWFSVIINATR